MVQFNACNWCGKVYRLKRGFLSGMILNRKYCCKQCQFDAEGKISRSLMKLHKLHLRRLNPDGERMVKPD